MLAEASMKELCIQWNFYCEIHRRPLLTGEAKIVLKMAAFKCSKCSTFDVIFTWVWLISCFRSTSGHCQQTRDVLLLSSFSQFPNTCNEDLTHFDSDIFLDFKVHPHFSNGLDFFWFQDLEDSSQDLECHNVPTSPQMRFRSARSSHRAHWSDLVNSSPPAHWLCRCMQESDCTGATAGWGCRSCHWHAPLRSPWLTGKVLYMYGNEP